LPEGKQWHTLVENPGEWHSLAASQKPIDRAADVRLAY